MDLISGSSGFIGTRLARTMLQEGKTCRCLVRQQSQDGDRVVANLADKGALSKACHGVESVFHCAGHAHAFASLTDTDADQHWMVNFEGTRNLAEAAGQAGVKRFVFLSSIKAMADPGAERVGEDFPGLPKTTYGQSKRAAEEVVLDAGLRFKMHVVNLRLTMVYGSGGRGNLERMGRLVRKGWFPPLPETGNHRSLVHVDDVVAAMLMVADDERANGRTYIIAGPEAPSGRQLYDTMHNVLGLPLSRWSVPETVLRAAGRCGDLLERVLNRRVPLDSEAVDRLLGSAWYSGDRIARELVWQPKVSLREGLLEMFGC